MFKGTEVLFYLLGILTTLGAGIIFKLNRRFALGGMVLVMVGTSLFLFVFTIAWSVSSLIEGETQAAGLGIVFFGLPSLIIAFLSRRFFFRALVKKS